MMDLTKEAFFPHPPDDVWIALTDKYAVAEWLMPNNFEPIEGKKFNFHVDKMPLTGFTGVTECEVLEVDRPKKLVYTWVSMHKTKGKHPPMTLTWTLEPHEGGTRLTLAPGRNRSPQQMVAILDEPRLGPHDKEVATESLEQRHRWKVHPWCHHAERLRDEDGTGRIREVGRSRT